MNLSIVFVDSYAKKESHLDDEVQQQHFKEETDKVWEFALTSPEFKFKTVDQVLEENAIMRDEIICLNGFIDDELKNTTDRMDKLEAMLSQESVERKMRENAIVGDLEQEATERKSNDENILGTLDILNAELAGNITVLLENMTQFEKQVEEEMSKVKTSPVGSIVAWITKPEQEAEKENSVLPDGWVHCDGKPIPEPSIWAGAHTPNLNGDKRFLRGGSYQDQLTEEDDTLQDHTHDDHGHTHTDKGHKHGYYDYVTSIEETFGCNWGNEYRMGPKHIATQDRFDCSYHRSSSSMDTAQASISTSHCGVGFVPNTYRSSGETKPKNMNVQWIMRVW